MALYKTYYVANDGLDTNTGLSEAKPWKTLAKVNSFPFQPGDTVRLKNGHKWRETLRPTAAGEYRKPIRITCYKGQNFLPIIYGSTRFVSWFPEVVGAFTAYWATAPVPVLTCIHDTIRAKRVFSKAALVERSFYYDVPTSRLYVRLRFNEDPFPSHVIEGGQRSQAIDITTNYVEIKRIETNFSNGDGIALRGTGCVADECLAYDCFHAGLGVYGSDCRSYGGFHSGNGTNMWIEGTELARNAGFVSEYDWCSYSFADTPGTDGLGFYATRMDDARVDHLVIRGSAFHAMTLDASNGNTFTNCEAEVNDGSGIRLLNHSNTNRFRWTLIGANYSRYANGWCVEIDGSDANKFDYVAMLGQRTDEGVTAGTANLVRISGPESKFSKFDNCVLLGLYGNERGFTFEGANPAGWGTVIKNCIYHGSSHAMFFNYASSPANAAVDIDFNCWYRVASANIILWNATEYTLATWRALTVHDDNSFAVDPKFVDAAGGDVRLNSNSPCINEGTNLNYERDYYGGTVPVGPAPDIGVHERAGGVVTPPYLSGEKEP